MRNIKNITIIIMLNLKVKIMEKTKDMNKIIKKATRKKLLNLKEMIISHMGILKTKIKIIIKIIKKIMKIKIAKIITKKTMEKKSIIIDLIIIIKKIITKKTIDNNL